MYAINKFKSYFNWKRVRQMCFELSKKSQNNQSINILQISDARKEAEFFGV